MKICMITSFFGQHSYGGDSVYVERLSQALVRSGHEVHIAYSSGAFNLTRGSRPPRQYQAPQYLKVHNVGNGNRGKIAAFWNHQTGGTGLEFQALGTLLKSCVFDLIHLHNVSLLGGRFLPRLLSKQPQAVKFVTAHDYWWICPQNLFWKYGYKVCDSRACISCSIRAKRPPQLWRLGRWFNKAVAPIDMVLFPSQHAMEVYRSRGFEHPWQRVMPGLLPADWREDPNPEENTYGSQSRPYFAAAGRLVIEKGFQKLIPVMRKMPDIDLRIAGRGPAEGMLQSLSRGMPNVKFEGLLDHSQIRALFRAARGVVVPSLFPETFGMVAAEAMSLGIPVIVHNRGALPELIKATSGGLKYDCESELVDQMRCLASDDHLFACLSKAASARIPSVWYEKAHTREYLENAEIVRGEAASV